MRKFRERDVGADRVERDSLSMSGVHRSGEKGEPIEHLLERPVFFAAERALAEAVEVAGRDDGFYRLQRAVVGKKLQARAATYSRSESEGRSTGRLGWAASPQALRANGGCGASSNLRS